MLSLFVFMYSLQSFLQLRTVNSHHRTVII